MDERQLKMISIAGAVLSVIAIYIFVSYLAYEGVKIGDITRAHAGRTVNVTGTVQRMSVTDGNAFITLSDGTGEIRVVLWRDVMEGMRIRGVDPSSTHEGVNMSVIGEVTVSGGYLEIVPSRPLVSIS